MSSAGPPGDAVGVVEIDIPSSVELVTVVRMLVATAASANAALQADRLDDLRWVTSEAVTNAIQANQSKAESTDAKPGRVVTHCEIAKGTVHLVVRDEGPGMPPEVDVPDIEHPDRLHLEGGFGVPLMRNLTRGAISFQSSPLGTTVSLEVSED